MDEKTVGPISITIESEGSSQKFVLHGLNAKVKAVGSPQVSMEGVYVPWSLDDGWSGNSQIGSNCDH